MTKTAKISTTFGNYKCPICPELFPISLLSSDDGLAFSKNYFLQWRMLLRQTATKVI